MKLNEVYHLIIYCLNCIRRDQNSTYKTGLNFLLHGNLHTDDNSSMFETISFDICEAPIVNTAPVNKQLNNGSESSLIEISNSKEIDNNDSSSRKYVVSYVCTYIKSSIDFTTIDELNDSPFESLWVYLRPNRLPRGFSCLIIGIIYHPPQDDDATFTDHLISSLDAALNKYPNAGIMLVGDFNRLYYRYISNHFNLRQTVKNPTRGAAILDLIFTNLFHHYNTPQFYPESA